MTHARITFDGRLLDGIISKEEIEAYQPALAAAESMLA
jgi:hypothetical protein